jgi:hypothetical protein
MHGATIKINWNEFHNAVLRTFKKSGKLYTQICTQPNVQLKSACDLQLFLELFLVGQHLKKWTKDCDIHCRTCCVNSFESISNNRVASIQRNQERKGRIWKLCSHPTGTISPHCSSVWSFHRLTSKLMRRKTLVLW